MAEDVKFFHVHDHKTKRHMTVARKVFLDANIVKYAYSVCHPNDNFSRKFGRDRAAGKLSSKQHKVVRLNGHRPIETILLDMISRKESILERLPRTVRNLAQQKLDELTSTSEER